MVKLYKIMTFKELQNNDIFQVSNISEIIFNRGDRL